MPPRTLLKPEEVDEQWREYYDFNRQEVLQVGKTRLRGLLHIWATCPECGAGRWSPCTAIRTRAAGSPRCRTCSITGPNSAVWCGGRISGSRGYIHVAVSTLPPEERALFKDMVNRRGYIPEHRLIIARHLGRPLLRGRTELVHHLNGLRDDNRLENLRLLKVRNHTSGHGDAYYQKWQEALSEIERLKKELPC